MRHVREMDVRREDWVLSSQVEDVSRSLAYACHYRDQREQWRPHLVF